MEHLAQLVAHQVDQALEIELGGQALLHAVDDRELGVALLGLVQQAAGLGKQPGILQGHTQAGGQGAQQPHVRAAEGVLVEALQGDDPDLMA